MQKNKKNNLRPARLTQKRVDYKKIAVFSVKFFLIYFILQLLVLFLDFSLVNSFLAKTTAEFLDLSYAGAKVFVNGEVFEVTNSCIGLMSASILAAAIFSLNKPALKKRILLFFFGLLFLLLLNIPRLIIVLASALNGMNAEFVHELTWFGMSAAVLLIWFFGLKRISTEKEFRELL